MRFQLAFALASAWITLVVASEAGAVPISEELVSFETHRDLNLEGILSFPENEPGPFPGIIAGSGLHDAVTPSTSPCCAAPAASRNCFAAWAAI